MIQTLPVAQAAPIPAAQPAQDQLDALKAEFSTFMTRETFINLVGSARDLRDVIVKVREEIKYPVGQRAKVAEVINVLVQDALDSSLLSEHFGNVLFDADLDGSTQIQFFNELADQIVEYVNTQESRQRRIDAKVSEIKTAYTLDPAGLIALGNIKKFAAQCLHLPYRPNFK